MIRPILGLTVTILIVTPLMSWRAHVHVDDGPLGMLAAIAMTGIVLFLGVPWEVFREPPKPAKRQKSKFRR